MVTPSYLPWTANLKNYNLLVLNHFLNLQIYMLENMKAINLSNIILCEIKELMFCTSSLSNFSQEFKVFLPGRCLTPLRSLISVPVLCLSLLTSSTFIFTWSLSDSSDELRLSVRSSKSSSKLSSLSEEVVNVSASLISSSSSGPNRDKTSLYVSII